MALSRLRLRLASGFAFLFAAGLAVFAAGALGYLWSESNARVQQNLDDMVHDIGLNVAFEMREFPDSNTVAVASEVVSEWPRNGGKFALTDSAGLVLAHAEDSTTVEGIVAHWRATNEEHFDMRVKAVPYRVATKFAAFAPPPRGPRKTPVTIGIVAFANTEGIAQDTSQLLTAVAIALPLILLLSLGGGYLMARRALRPVAELGAAVAAIAPTELTRRLPVTEPRDEIGALAAEFNGLLGRLSDAQSQNRRFLREAAHQIRTPLTLVLGEAAHELAAKETNPERMRGSLTRIGQAAERMRRRVDELFLLAEAQAGEKVALEDEVELDELALSSADLMRPRATSLGRSLAIGTAEHVVTRGNAALLHEAVLELFENALRHGNGTRPVTVSVSRRGANAVIDVSSGGTPFSLPAQAASQGPDGLGLPIVRWVAETHDGTLSVAHHNGLNVVGITLPVRS